MSLYPANFTKLAVFLGSLFILIVATSQANNALDPQSGLERVDRYLKDVQTMSAHFRMSLYDSEMTLVQESFGTLKVKRPGRFRWDYIEPYEQLILSDGEKLWLYDRDLEQASVKNLSTSLSASPAMLLSGTGELSEGFEVVGAFTDDTVVWVTLTPRSNDTDFSRFSLGFEDDKLRFMDLADRLDQLTRIEFDNVRRNPDLGDELFRFEPPENVDVIGDS